MLNTKFVQKTGNSGKILENIGTTETGFIQAFVFIPDFILNSRILPSRAQPTTLQSYLTYYVYQTLGKG